VPLVGFTRDLFIASLHTLRGRCEAHGSTSPRTVPPGAKVGHHCDPHPGPSGAAVMPGVGAAVRPVMPGVKLHPGTKSTRPNKHSIGV